VIRPGAKAAIDSTERATIGVLATAGTVATRAYTRALERLAPGIETIEVACPRFVPLVEAGEYASQAAVAAASEYLAPILRSGADTVILGCTHYPFLMPALAEAAPGVRFIDPASATAAELEDALTDDGQRMRKNEPAESRFFTTGALDTFRAQLEALFPEQAAGASSVSWDEIRTAPEPAVWSSAVRSANVTFSSINRLGS
jgi:glutamate racemase